MRVLTLSQFFFHVSGFFKILKQKNTKQASIQFDRFGHGHESYVASPI